jgi:hypothetical protein
MTVYRTTRQLRSRSHGSIQAGERTRLDWLRHDEVQILLDRGIVRVEECPRLSELAGWRTRAKRLTALDVHTVEEFLDADPVWLANELHVKPETVRRWNRELETWFTAPPAKRG